jgi:hypothetical protein
VIAISPNNLQAAIRGLGVVECPILACHHLLTDVSLRMKRHPCRSSDANTDPHPLNGLVVAINKLSGALSSTWSSESNRSPIRACAHAGAGQASVEAGASHMVPSAQMQCGH